MNMALLHTAEYRYFVRIEVTPHTRSLSNFSEFTYTVLQAGSISEKSCAQVVASPRYSESLEAYVVRDCTARALGTYEAIEVL